MLTDEDVAYVRAEFVPLADLCESRGEELEKVHGAIAAGVLPRPSYVLDDATEMVPGDYFELADEAGGRELLRERFLARYRRAAALEPGLLGEAEAEWTAYLSGEYGVCLKTVSPETIVRKTVLVSRLEALLDRPRPEEEGWRTELRQSVAELDALERPFAPRYDRLRFGGPTSRERLIDRAYERYPEAFTAHAVAT